MNVSQRAISNIAESINTDYASLMAFISVESGGSGFDPKTGKIIIQFEPTWFRRLTALEMREYQRLKTRMDTSLPLDMKEYHLYCLWNIVLTNKVEGQAAEWKAFNAAFTISKKAALLSTSIGIMQIMGFNCDSCGYNNVDEMWNDFKTGEEAQIRAGAKFIKSKPLLHKALLNQDWANVAYFYNGADYARNNYHIKLSEAHQKYSA